MKEFSTESHVRFGSEAGILRRGGVWGPMPPQPAVSPEEAEWIRTNRGHRSDRINEKAGYGFNAGPGRGD